MKPSAPKPWPPGDELVDFDQLVGPLASVLKQAGRWIPKAGRIKYNGYDIGKKEQATCLSPDFSKESLAVAREHGETVVDVVLKIAFQLGVEQGRRMARKEAAWERRIERLRMAIDNMKGEA